MRVLTVRKRVCGPEERRFRAFWRVTLPLLLTLVGLILLSIAGMLVTEAFGIEPAGQQVITYLLSGAFVVGVLVLSAQYIDDREIQDYGFAISRRWLTDFVAGAALGVFLVGLLFAITHLLGWVTVIEVISTGNGSFLGMMILFLVGFAAVGFWEETLYRGIFITNALEGISGRDFSARNTVIAAWVASSLVFGASHLLFLSVPEGVSVGTTLVMWIVMGGLLGLAYLLAGELAFPIGLHFTFNYAINNLFFNLPEHDAAGIPGLLHVEVTAPDVWHPIGGLSMLPIILFGYVLTLGWFYWRGY